MQIVAAGRQFDVVEGTSPVAGRRTVALVGSDGSAWPDLFLWDPRSQVVTYDSQQVRAFITQAKLSDAPWAKGLLTVTDAITSLGRGVHRLASGGYGGLFGFGSLGGVVASAGALFNLCVQAAVFVVTLPFRALGGCVRLWLSSAVRAEEAKLIQTMPGIFEQLPDSVS